jgi:hypothetical protein
MALRDLVAQSSALAEEAIENIVKDFVRYDTEAGEIAFLPDFAALPNKSKVLVYLVALQGWVFVTEAPIETPTKPADIGDKVGIPGGTLRPLLKELKDRHLISSSAGGYVVRAAFIPAVERELVSGNGVSTAPAKRRRSRATAKARESKVRVDTAGVGTGSEKRRQPTKGIGEAFDRWVAEGFFSDGRTLAEVQSRFHEEAIIIRRTSIPKYLLKAVRAKSLSRSKRNFNGKTVWVYESK